MGCLTVGAVLIGTMAPAAAHAALVGSDPEDGASVPALPEQVTLEFNEPVGASSEVAVTGPDGSTIPVEDLSVLDREVTATVGASTLRGEHVIAYRVVSADGHPVTGQIVVTTTEGDSAEQSGTPATADEDESFVHRHRDHLLWGGLIGAVAVALIVLPLLRRRRP